MEPHLWQTWQQTASRYSSHQDLINRLWQELLNAYSSPSRHYHTFHHIAALLRLTQAHENHLTAPTLVRLAVFYHDAVYSAARSDNEEKSAQLAQERLSHLGVPYPETTLVTEMIMATKTHQAGSHLDLNFLLDADLSILGAPWEDYLLYSQQIRKEYSLYPDFLYNPGRRKVLRHFLLQDSIFKTPYFRASSEAQARQNLAKELQLLSAH